MGGQHRSKHQPPPDFGTDWGIPYSVVPADQPEVPINFTDYASSSDPGPYPIPADAQIEGNGEGDSHVIAVASYPNCHLYELYGASEGDPSGSSWTAASGAVFDLNSNALRPAGWTSADAAGLPIFPGLAREDEVATGAIDHALRFTVSNTQRGFIAPATHWASSSTNPSLPPMGARFRLKASFDISGYTGQAKIILQALKTYGMILADNGSNWFITGAPSSQWDNDDLDQLKTVPGSAFEAVDTGPITTDTNNPPQDPTPLTQTTPTISNTTPAVGDTLTATAGTFGPVTPVTVTYQWYRSGQPISGAAAQAQTYTVQKVDLGAILTVKVTGSDREGNYSFVTTESDPTAAVTAATTPPLPTTGTVTVDSSFPVAADGTASHTVTATVTAGGLPTAGQTVNFTASSGAKLSQTSAVTNASGAATVTVSSKTAGSYTVTASATDSNGAAVSFTPATVSTLFAAAATAPPATPAVNPTQGKLVTGTATAGTTVKVTSSTAPSTVLGTVLVGSTGSFQVTLNPAQTAGTTLTVTATDSAGNVSSAATTTVLVTTTATRIQGPDRYSTAVAAAQQNFPNGASTVFLAVGTNYPDAISAGPAAGKLNAPILLTQTSTLTGVTLQELNTLHPSKVIVLGDTVSVSAATLHQVQTQVSSKPAVVRISGIDRYATNRALVEYVWGHSAATVFVATGQNFTDAEVAASTASAAGDPVVLVNGNAASLDSATKSLLADLKTTTIHAVGSTTNLDPTVFSGLTTITSTDRTSGTDPVSTSIAAAKAFFPKASQVYLASTDDFADALVAGALAGKTAAPVLFTTDSLSPGITTEIIALGASRVFVMGDSTRITTTAFIALDTALGITE